MSFAAQTQANVDLVWLMKVTKGSDIWRLFFGLGELWHAGDAYVGIGDSGAIGPLSGSVDLEASTLDFVLPGLPSAARTSLLDPTAQGAVIELMAGVLNPGLDTWARVPQVEAVRIVDTVAVVAESSNGDPGTLTLVVSTIDAGAYIRKYRPARYTPEDYERSYPGRPSMRFRAALRGGVVTGAGVGISPNPGITTATGPGSGGFSN